jgi:putative sterol carrier protein
MSERGETEAGTSFPQWVQDLPFLSNFHTPLPRLAEPGAKDLDATFVRLGELLGAPEAPLAVRIQVSDGEHVRSWLLDAGPTGCRVTDDTDGPPDVEAMLDAETWTLIASGAMSPLEAFSRGSMRARGDLRAARRLARQLYRTDTMQS